MKLTETKLKQLILEELDSQILKKPGRWSKGRHVNLPITPEDEIMKLRNPDEEEADMAQKLADLRSSGAAAQADDLGKTMGYGMFDDKLGYEQTEREYERYMAPKTAHDIMQKFGLEDLYVPKDLVITRAGMNEKLYNSSEAVDSITLESNNWVIEITIDENGFFAHVFEPVEDEEGVVYEFVDSYPPSQEPAPTEELNSAIKQIENKYF